MEMEDVGCRDVKTQKVCEQGQEIKPFERVSLLMLLGKKRGWTYS